MKEAGAALMNREQQRKNNLRMALTLASIAALFALGFMAKIALFGF